MTILPMTRQLMIMQPMIMQPMVMQPIGRSRFATSTRPQAWRSRGCTLSACASMPSLSTTGTNSTISLYVDASKPYPSPILHFNPNPKPQPFIPGRALPCRQDALVRRRAHAPRQLDAECAEGARVHRGQHALAAACAQPSWLCVLHHYLHEGAARSARMGSLPSVLTKMTDKNEGLSFAFLSALGGSD